MYSGLPVSAPVDVLEVATSGIAGPAYDEYRAVGVGEERGQGVLAHIWIDRDRVEAPFAEVPSGVGGCGTADIANLAVQQHRDVSRDQGASLQQSVQAIETVRRIKPEVRLVDRGNIGGRLDDLPVERHNRIAAVHLPESLRETGDVWIESNTDQRVLRLDSRIESLSKGHVPVSYRPIAWPSTRGSLPPYSTPVSGSRAISCAEPCQPSTGFST